MDNQYEPISLGFSCGVKYQLSRTLFARKFPNGVENDFRNILLSPEYGQRNFERHIFDWQITPFPAVLEYLERDFAGVFELEDLVVEDGEVVHRRLRTRHPHDFHAINGTMDDAAISAGYAQARSKFEHLAQKFRTLLTRPGPYLYVGMEIRIYDEAVRFIDQVRARNPDQDFKLLFVGYEGEDQNLEGLKGTAFKAWAPLHAQDKPADRQWEGDNAAWDKVLEPWTLTVHGGDRIVSHEDENQARAPGPRRPGWLSRLWPRNTL